METKTLEEILQIISESFAEGKITIQDLNEITLFTIELRSKKNQYDFAKFQKISNFLIDGGVEKSVAIKMIDDFNKRFETHSNLAEKVFAFGIEKIFELLCDQKDIEIQLAQRNSNLCLVVNNYLVEEGSVSQPSNIVELVRAFNTTLITDINTVLKTDGTESILIPYKTNFDQFNGNVPTTVVLVPGIGDSGRMTLVMHFLDQDGNIMKFETEDYMYYDTFTLRPPYTP